MKKLVLIVFAISVIFVGNIYASGSACEEWTNFNISGKYGERWFESGIKVVRFGCIADNANGSFPSTAFSAGTMGEIIGWSLLMASTVNGTPAPTDQWAFTLKDADGVDILGAAGTKRPGGVGISSQLTPITDTGYATSQFRPITSNLTLAATGNIVNSAITTIILLFIKTN
jgi:hypothetical protein